ncbi:mannose-1-phosphate guanylyltransferase/mannose-6-phosphate isomerase [Marinobacterium jannaschii]|uniref:mannose-1-phosphate guanylyltransferase/mannose-6-phosphate isomerase n=1 Tax=Marinobacterium jannaschii TaxID=64970 RepID=UPI0004837E1E|nr:mannose-1-phosphate guanylyltransferase/mannose-6-phosphate isomerase [Marinobacterium jannaschii]
MIVPVVLAGGSGLRLWPLSRVQHPKQFHCLSGEQSLLQQTLQRLPDCGIDAPIVVSNEEHRFLVAEQLRQIGIRARILLEPEGRNTAPSIALAALDLEQRGTADAVMLVLAADHQIRNTEQFQRQLMKAIDAAADGSLVTFGVVADSPATGYGYIRAEAIRPGAELCRIAEFCEKPDAATAQHYLDCGDYYWNSGIFVFRADSYLQALRQHCPAVFQACRQAIAAPRQDQDFIRIAPEPFCQSPDISIDYAVMEYTQQGLMLPLDVGWSDLGSWGALWDLHDKDAQQNVIRGDVITEQTRGSYIQAGHKLVSTLGVEDLVIVDTADALLVADRKKVQDVKGLVSQLAAAERAERLHHRQVLRPWGCYETLARGERHHVKRITVNPGASLSLQRHQYRAEHWVVVEGTARVRCGDQLMILSEDQSTYIPVGEIHQLSNPGVTPLEIIEVQSGSYLGEDDITRFDDDYGRS